jgi:hypothetical protein
VAYSVYLLSWYKSTQITCFTGDRGADGQGEGVAAATQITCVTSTKVQILTPEEQVAKAKALQQEETARQLAQAQLEHCKVKKALSY